MIRTEVLCSKMQRPSRPRLQRRPRADGPALLHQFSGAEAASPKYNFSDHCPLLVMPGLPPPLKASAGQRRGAPGEALA